MQAHHPGQFLQRNSDYLLEAPSDLDGIANIKWWQGCPGLVTPNLVLLRRPDTTKFFLCHLRDLVGRELDTTLWAWRR